MDPGKPAKCVIIDDEDLAVDLLKDYINKTKGLEIASVFYESLKAKQYLQENNVDLIFTDINMPNLNGLKLIDTLNKDKRNVIITTAYSEFALEGFELNVIDYLLKPISYQRFLSAIEKAQRYLYQNQILPQPIVPKSPENEGPFIIVKSESKFVKIELNSIRYVEGLKQYLKIHCVNNCYVVMDSFINMQNILPENEFLRIHKSYMVSKKHVTGFTSKIVMLGNTSIPVGNIFKDNVKNFLIKA